MLFGSLSLGQRKTVVIHYLLASGPNFTILTIGNSSPFYVCIQS
jgi:hypothetical protein